MRDLNVRSYILVLFFGLFLLGMIVVGIQQGWGLFRLPTVEKTFNENAINQAGLADDVVDMLAVDLLMKLIPPSSSEDQRLFTLELGRIQAFVRDDNPTIDVQETCLDFITVLVYPENESIQQLWDFLTQPLCIPASDDLFIADQTPLGNIMTDNFYVFDYALDSVSKYESRDPDQVSLNFWYPYDGFDMPLWLLVKYTVYLSDGTVKEGTLPPYMAWDIQTSGSRMWDVQLQSETSTAYDETTNQEFTYENVTIAMARPWLYRIAFPFFIVMMVLLIGLVPLLGDRDTLVDISAAMLFGIFGLKGIMSPGDQMGRTVLDIALIALYVILAFAGILFFINKVALRVKDDDKPTEQSTES
jgi:hypothetical protein